MILCLLKRAAKIEHYFYAHNLFRIFFSFSCFTFNLVCIVLKFVYTF